MRIFLLKNRSERCSLRYGSDKLHSSYPVQGYVVNADIFIRLTKISGKKKNEEYQMGLNYEVGDIVTLKKAHPCGSKEWEILRVGADFRLKCMGCGHQIMVARRLVEKNTRDLKKFEKNSIYALHHGKDMLKSTIVIYFISLLFDRQRAKRP